jgi:hypothetical protein
MSREECENQILEKLKEIKAIAKQYDKSTEFYISLSIFEDVMSANNSYWETETPLNVSECTDGRRYPF